ncbi:protease FtsH-inhibitory lysogeny factor CIII [Escherichia coli]|uniref:protease FtsH-inhibitory lysogeny factor CIII n=1 Tax=Escherichia coli TaxID=562 RepID=UPI003860154D
MQYAIAGWPVAGCPSESLLERITRKLRVKWSTKTGHRVRVFPVSIFRFVWG